MSTKGQREQAAERRLKAFELRKAGASFRQIGRELGVSEAQAHRDIMQALETLAKLTEPEVQHLRMIELQRLDEMQARLWPLITHTEINPVTGMRVPKPDQFAIDRVIRIMERRARLSGIDAPLRVNLDLDREIENLLREVRQPDADDSLPTVH
jgi:hypothetical protein